jgi:hypothetical protein
MWHWSMKGQGSSNGTAQVCQEHNLLFSLRLSQPTSIDESLGHTNVLRNLDC